MQRFIRTTASPSWIRLRERGSRCENLCCGVIFPDGKETGKAAEKTLPPRCYQLLLPVYHQIADA